MIWIGLSLIIIGLLLTILKQALATKHYRRTLTAMIRASEQKP